MVFKYFGYIPCARYAAASARGSSRARGGACTPSHTNTAPCASTTPAISGARSYCVNDTISSTEIHAEIDLSNYVNDYKSSKLVCYPIVTKDKDV